jgi:PTH1 family peptidyl-tRNA hydrolase
MLKLLVGLGNPGASYQKHRHNVGYWLIDALVKKHKLKEREKPGYIYYEWAHDFGETILLKSKKYMNDSGHAVQSIQSFYKWDLEDIWVAYDDMDFSPGCLRVKKGKGAGGHNGIKSIIQQVGPDFHRLRFGVDRPKDPGAVKNYVLTSPTVSDRRLIEGAIDNTLMYIDLLCEGRYDAFIEKIHSER